MNSNQNTDLENILIYFLDTEYFKLILLKIDLCNKIILSMKKIIDESAKDLININYFFYSLLLLN